MTDIHYFPRYSQQENVVTNNTLLLLLRLYQYNRFKFEKFMEALCGEQDIQLGSSWLQFRQQKGTGKSVVDGFIAQDSIKIAVETKLGSAFDVAQLRNHLAVFQAEQHKLLILLSPSRDAVVAGQVEAVRRRAASRNVQVLHTTFEEVVDKARRCLSDHDEEMHALVDDYESFCSAAGVLPRDAYTMFVPPCSQSIEDNKAFALYYCPAAWSRRKAEYLGTYADKAVRAVGRIAKVVACDVDPDACKVVVMPGEPTITTEERQRILGAARHARQREWDLRTGHKFYLCSGKLEETSFRKISSGGIMGHRYFDLERVLGGKIPVSLAELAAKLREPTWE